MSKSITIISPSGATLKTKNKYMDDDVAVQVDGAENITANNIKSGVTILGVLGNMATVVANPTLEGGESDLTSVEIEGTKYSIPSGTEVTANPTLAGTENDLTGLEVNGVKYAVPSGSGSNPSLYQHKIRLRKSTVYAPSGSSFGTDFVLFMMITNASSTPLTFSDFVSLSNTGNDYGLLYGTTITGIFLKGTKYIPVISAGMYNSSRLNFNYINFENGSINSQNIIFDSVNNFEDTITQL